MAFGCGAGAGCLATAVPSPSVTTAEAFAPFPEVWLTAAPSPVNSLKYARQESSTNCGLLRNLSNSVCTYSAFAPNSSAIVSDKSVFFCWLKLDYLLADDIVFYFFFCVNS